MIQLATQNERESYARRLQATLEKLKDKGRQTLKDLPEPLQKELREYELLGNLTSSGLEHVDGLIDRIGWLIYYLNDPTFPANYTIPKSTQIPVNKNPQERSHPVAQPDLHPTPTATTNNSPLNLSPEDKELEFGPFDPRGQQ